MVQQRTRRVVVTGAAGFIGREVVRACLARGDEVVGIDVAATDVTAPDLSPARSVIGDLTVPDGWASTFDGVDLVVHTAAIVTEAGDRDRFVAVNVDGTRNVCEAAADAGVGRVVHVSSTVVYGDRFPVGSMRTESDALVPTGGPYTDTKIAAEHAALTVAARRDVDVTIVRPGDVYGPRSVPWVLRPLDLLRRGRFLLVDGGRWPLSPVHVDDVVAGIVTAGDADVAAGRIYNLAGPPVPAREVFAVHARHTGGTLRSVPKPAAIAAARAAVTAARAVGRPAPFAPEAIEYVTHPGGYAVDRARMDLGWSPAVAWDRGLPAVLVAADAQRRG